MPKKLLLLLSVLFVLPSLAFAEKRMGLVIGNDSYINVPILEKARNDASAISDTLTDLGFDVTKVLDADRRTMNRAISAFTAKLQPGDTALVFFAGHGVEIEGENYLLPVDIDAPDTASEDFVKFESLSLSDVLLRVQNTGARTTLMFIDACRDNPFATTGGRSIGSTRGLARVTAPEGTFVVFSAGARQQALDRLNGPDENPNSVFTRILLPKLQVADLELRQLVSQVRVEVRDLALMQNHQQFPAYYDELLGQFYFNPNGAIAAPVVAETAVMQSDLQSDFARARSINSIVAYEVFLEKYSGKNDLELDIARRELASLRAVNDLPLAVEPAQTTTGGKAIMRASQERLNALGCAAGAADGVVGPRTRRAFATYLKATKANLQPSDLGTLAALEHMKTADDLICMTVEPEPAPEAAKTATAKTAPRSLAGNWTFNAQCPLIATHGTTTYTSNGGGSYAVVSQDNIGNVGRGSATDLGDGSLAVSINWQSGLKDVYTAVVSSDRRAISGTNVLGCRFMARKLK